MIKKDDFLKRKRRDDDTPYSLFQSFASNRNNDIQNMFLTNILSCTVILTNELCLIEKLTRWSRNDKSNFIIVQIFVSHDCERFFLIKIAN